MIKISYVGILLISIALVLFIQHYLRPRNVHLLFMDYLPNLITAFAFPFFFSLFRNTDRVFISFYFISFGNLVIHEYYRTFDGHLFDWIDILFTIIGLIINLYFVSVFKLSKFK